MPAASAVTWRGHGGRDPAAVASSRPMTPRSHVRHHVRKAPVRAVLLSLVVACTGGDGAVSVAVDGGSDGVVLLDTHAVEVPGGQTLTVVSGAVAASPAPEADHEDAPVTHAFVGGVGDELPPLFTRTAEGLSPNPGVWGQCRGGPAAAAGAGCPIPPVEGPQAWDGGVYWSTGALLPGESREVPIAPDITAGEYVLVCALHPQLRVNVVVGDGPDAEPPGEPVRVADAVGAAAALAGDLGAGEVLAGAVVDAAYVGRFVPAEIRIAAGETVTWSAQGRAPVDVVFGVEELDLTHTDPSDGVPDGNPEAWDGRGELRSGFLSGDPTAGATAQTWTVTFTRPGRYEYASRFGAGFTGTVVVEEP